MAVVFFNNLRQKDNKEFIALELSTKRNEDNQLIITLAIFGLGMVIVFNI